MRAAMTIVHIDVLKKVVLKNMNEYIPVKNHLNVKYVIGKVPVPVR